MEVHIPGQQVHKHAKACLLAPGVREVDFLDVLFSQDADPLVRIADVDDVAHIKIGAHIGAVNFIQKTLQLKRGEQKLVPHIFNAHADPGLGGVRRQGAQPLLRVVIGNLIGSDPRGKVCAHPAGHHQHRVSAQGLGAVNLLFDDVLGMAGRLFILAGKVVFPQVPGAHGADG